MAGERDEPPKHPRDDAQEIASFHGRDRQAGRERRTRPASSEPHRRRGRAKLARWRSPDAAWQDAIRHARDAHPELRIGADTFGAHAEACRGHGARPEHLFIPSLFVFVEKFSRCKHTPPSGNSASM
jgi:hypothetical protein